MTEKGALYDILFNMYKITAITAGKGSPMPNSRLIEILSLSLSLSLIYRRNFSNLYLFPQNTFSLDISVLRAEKINKRSFCLRVAEPFD